MVVSFLLLILASVDASATNQLDELDKAEFDEAIAEAKKCLSDHDTACVERQLSIAQRRSTSSADKATVKRLRNAIGEQAQSLQEQEEFDERNREIARKEKHLQERQTRAEQARYSEQDQQPSTAETIARVGTVMNQSLANHYAEKQEGRERAAQLEQEAQYHRDQQTRSRNEQERRQLAQQRSDLALQRAELVQAEQHQATKVAQAAPTLSMRSERSPASQKESMPEALAFCWQTKKGGWLCDGPNDETTLAEKDRDGQLSGVSCNKPSLVLDTPISLTSVRVSKRGTVSGWLYYCGTKLKPGDTSHATWNRDIRRFWSGIRW
ncbi:hypothetical protein D3C79_329640 [compost metagenome]